MNHEKFDMEYKMKEFLEDYAIKKRMEQVRLDFLSEDIKKELVDIGLVEKDYGIDINLRISPILVELIIKTYHDFLQSNYMIHINDKLIEDFKEYQIFNVKL